MASAWGKAFGAAFGAAWGAISEANVSLPDRWVSGSGFKPLDLQINRPKQQIVVPEWFAPLIYEHISYAPVHITSQIPVLDDIPLLALKRRKKDEAELLMLGII